MEGALPAVYDETVAAPARVLGHGGFLGHAGGIVQMIRIRVLSLDGSAPAQPAPAQPPAKSPGGPGIPTVVPSKIAGLAEMAA